MTKKLDTLPSPVAVLACKHLAEDEIRTHFPEAKLIAVNGPEVKLTSRSFKAPLRELPAGDVAVVSHPRCPVFVAELTLTPLLAAELRKKFDNPKCGIVGAKQMTYLGQSLENIAQHLGREHGSQPHTWAYVLQPDGKLVHFGERAPKSIGNFFTSLCEA